VINQTKAIKLVKIYAHIYESFEKELNYTCQRFSNNDQQDLTDQKIMSIYSERQKNSDFPSNRFTALRLNMYAPGFQDLVLMQHLIIVSIIYLRLSGVCQPACLRNISQKIVAQTKAC